MTAGDDVRRAVDRWQQVVQAMRAVGREVAAEKERAEAEQVASIPRDNPAETGGDNDKRVRG